MKFSNFHTHCCFCDGEGQPEDFVKEAISQEFDAIGFTSHSPLEFSPWTIKEERVGEYIDTINELKEKYKDSIQIYTGLEIDYIPDIYGPRSDKFKKLDLDYHIGSVHAIKNEKTGEYLSVDGSREEFEEILYRIFHGSMEKLTGAFYGLIREMVKIHSPDIIGHLDLLKKNNKNSRYFTEEEEWYKEEVQKTLEVIAKSPCILEINTGGLSRNYTDTFYPSPWILMECKKLDIPIMINSDAHTSKNIGFYFEEAVSFLKDIGYEKQRVLYNGMWTDVEL